MPIHPRTPCPAPAYSPHPARSSDSGGCPAQARVSCGSAPPAHRWPGPARAPDRCAAPPAAPPGRGFARTPGEDAHELRLRSGQRLDRAILPAELAAGDVVPDLAEAQQVRIHRQLGRFAGAMQHRAHPEQQFARLERLAEIVIRSLLQSGDAVLGIPSERAQKQNRCPQAAAQRSRQIQAGFPGIITSTTRRSKRRLASSRRATSASAAPVTR